MASSMPDSSKRSSISRRLPVGGAETPPRNLRRTRSLPRRSLRQNQKPVERVRRNQPPWRRNRRSQANRPRRQNLGDNPASEHEPFLYKWSCRPRRTFRGSLVDSLSSASCEALSNVLECTPTEPARFCAPFG